MTLDLKAGRCGDVEDTHDADPMNMLVRAGYLAGLAYHSALGPDDCEMLRRASRSLIVAAEAIAAKEQLNELDALTQAILRLERP